MKSNIHIIAEAGSNNNGNLQKAINLAKIAKDAGADSVKFQMINTWGLYLPGEYEYGHYDIKEVIKIREYGEMSDEEYKLLNSECNKLDIPFTASIFDKKGLDLYLKFDPLYVKIASGDLNNIRLLRQVAERRKKLILSTGMSSLGDIEKSLNALSKENFDDIILLHCVSIYPARLEQTNLSFIKTLKAAFGFEVGFSDHTGDSIAACVAMSMGAKWFEKHFTEDKAQIGLDHKHALSPDELGQYVTDLRNTEITLNPLKSKISEGEFYTRKRARRSLYFSKDMKSGDVIKDHDILVVRPEGILNADDIDLVVGKKLIQDVKKYAPLALELLK